MQSISATDFFKKSTYNCETLNQLWCSQIADSHDSICSCNHPFAHLLSSIFPPGHTDRDLTINQILTRDFAESCLSGGKEERKTGMENSDTGAASTDIKAEEEKEFSGDEIERLLAAAAADDTR